MLIGVCLDNVDEPAEESWRKLAQLAPEVVGTLWTRVRDDDGGTRHGRAVYERIESLGRPTYHVRAGASRRMEAGEWIEAATAALGEVPAAALSEGRVRVRCLNEVNLEAEGGWEPEEYAAFLLDVAAEWRADVPLLCAPLSLGRADVWAWWERALTVWGVVAPAAGVSANGYAHLIGEVGRFLEAGRPGHVTEINTLEVEPGEERVQWLIRRLTELARAGWTTAEVFILGGRSYGAWDERYVLTEYECRRLGSWIALGSARGTSSR